MSSPREAVWLSIVGVSPDGGDSLSPAARAAIRAAELVVGSARQLAAVRELTTREVYAWPSPLSEGIAKVLARRGRSTCVLASGDPFFFGIGATLAPSLVPGEFVCYPAPSSLSLAAARLGWPLQDTEIVSLHGRELHGLIRYLQPNRRVLALSWDRRTPRALAELLCARGFGRSRLHVLQELGGAQERVHSALASEIAASEQGYADLNLVALELVAEPGASVLSCRAGLPDACFEHDGQLSKQEVRAIALAALEPRAGALLWDVGAGAGSIAIEWMLCHQACRAIAIERDPARCERIARNARALGVPGLRILEAQAPDGLDDLPAPDAIFIGGGASDSGVLERCWDALRSSRRLVVNAVSLEGERALLDWHARCGGELRRIGIERAAPLGRLRGFVPARPVVQWSVDKP